MSATMKWAVEAYDAAKVASRRAGLPWPAAAIQEAAEPLLAVVRAAVNENGTCALCWGATSRSAGHLPTCPVPAALQAMEETP